MFIASTKADSIPIQSETQEYFLHNVVLISAELIFDLAKVLDFEKVVQEVFTNKGIYKTGNHHSKALLISKRMNIFSTMW